MEDNDTNFTNLTNMSSRATECTYNYCVEATIYRQVIGTLIFIAVWPFIVQDVKYFPLGRPAAALLGATLMVVFTVTPQGQVFNILGNRENIQTICLLLGMMALSYYYDREGLLQIITLFIFGKKKPFKSVLWKICILSAVLSAFITNDATCVLITPLLLKEHIKQGRSKNEIPPLLLGIATSANIGSASTFFGNPQNAVIASQANLSLLTFFITSLPAAVIGLAINIGLLYLFNLKQLLKAEPAADHENEVHIEEQPKASTSSTEPELELISSIAEEREHLTLSYDQSDNPFLSSDIAKERNITGRNIVSAEPKRSEVSSLKRSMTWDGQASYARGATANTQGIQYGAVSSTVNSSIHVNVKTKSIENIAETETEIIKAKNICQRSLRAKIFLTWLVIVSIVMISLLAIPPLKHVQFNLGLVPVGVAVFTMLADTIIYRKYSRDVMIQVDWPVLLMFLGIFVWIAGFQNTLLPQKAFNKMLKYMNLSTIQGTLFFTVFVIIGSNIFSNVPLVLLIISEIENFECGLDDCSQLVGVLLAWISTIAGNMTLIGSIANLIVAEKAKSCADYNLTFWGYLKFGFLSTIIVLFTGLPMVYFSAKHIQII